MNRTFYQLDVFGARASSGNPLAVVCDARGLSDEVMQQFARWMNLSETAFLLPPSSGDADYRVRIFSLARELPFAGHPTLGSCHAWLAIGGKPRRKDMVLQECGAGIVPIRQTPGLAFATPPLRRGGSVSDAEMSRVTSALGISPSEVIDAAWVDNGPGWIGVLLESADAVLALSPRPEAFAVPGGLDIGVVGMQEENAEYAVEVRAFCSDHNGQMREDPVTGSLNGSLAQWLIQEGRLHPPYAARQGTCLGLLGRVLIDQAGDGRIWVGGSVTPLIQGTVAL